MIRTQTDVLLLPRDELALALTALVVGRELDWADSMACALAELEEALKEHTALAEQADGMYSYMDLNRPTLVRQVNQLRKEHHQMLAEVRSLQQMVHSARQAFRPQSTAEVFDGLPAMELLWGVPDFSALRERAERLLGQLERHEEAEDMLVMESYGTDIGAGD